MSTSEIEIKPNGLRADQAEPLYWRYWGKAKPESTDGPQYHLLAYHSLDVAAVGSQLLGANKTLLKHIAERLDVDAEWLRNWMTFCLALHDLGKFSRSFQSLVPDLDIRLVRHDSSMPYNVRHDTLGFVLWLKRLEKESLLAQVLKQNGLSTRVMDPWLEVMCGHHGVPPAKRANLNEYFHLEDEIAAEQFVTSAVELFKPDLGPLANHTLKSNIKQVSWQLAGIAVLADWLGSDQKIFKYHNDPMPLFDYWESVACPRAAEILEVLPIGKMAIEPFESINHLFEFIVQPTPLQRYAAEVSMPAKPQLHILEDVTGAGKTEAALVLAQRMLSAGLAEGIYIALPTMATSNAMYRRMAASYRKLFDNGVKPSLVLAHGARHLSDQFTQSVFLSTQPQDQSYRQGDDSASAYCNAWLADNRKKALLADVGVGTLDQALLAVLPARHQSLRLLGLTRKVLIVDEVHAYDPYMRELMATLLTAHAKQGGSAILLSATLPRQMREQFLSAYGGVQERRSEKYFEFPLATRLYDKQLQETPINTRDTVKRQVVVKRLTDIEEVLALIKHAVANGHCVCWVRNTVKAARQAYSLIQQQSWMANDHVKLFHSRFAMVDRRRIEDQTLDMFGHKSTSAIRSGRVLVATQVVEQSLDLDFDVMISDLAPMDLLIQRAGRLQRHCRDRQGNLIGGADQRGPAILYLLAPEPSEAAEADWLKSLLPGTDSVYPNTGHLWLTARLIEQQRGFTMPDDARDLIEGVYGEDVEPVPVSLEIKSLQALGEARSQQGMARLNRLKLDVGYTRGSAEDSGGWDEDTRIPTRLSEDTVTVALAKVENGELKPYAQEERHAWSLSQLSIPVREWEKVKDLVSDEIHEEINTLRQNQQVLKWVQVLPLIEPLASYYQPDNGWSIQEKINNELA